MGWVGGSEGRKGLMSLKRAPSFWHSVENFIFSLWRKVLQFRFGEGGWFGLGGVGPHRPPPPPQVKFPSSRRTESRMVRPKECIRLYGPVIHCDTSTQTQLEGVAVFHAPSSSATHRY